jgi:hypothetical protein
MSNGIGPQNGIPAGQFNQSLRAENKSEIDLIAFSHFLRLRSGSRELQEITPCLSRGLAVVSAAKSGHDDIVEGLLQSGPISTYYCGEGVRFAAENGHLQVVERLLQRWPEFYGHAVVAAAGKGHIDIIKKLLEGDAQISEDHRHEAVMNAAGEGHLEVLEWLIHLWPEFLGVALIRVLENGQISEDHRRYAVESAARHGHHELVNRVLLRWPEFRCDAVVGAAYFGQLQLIEMLLQSGSISDEYRGMAVGNAAEKGHLEVVERLLKRWPEFHGHAVVVAAKNDHIDIFEKLLEGDAQMSELDCGLAVRYAAEYGRLEVIEKLLQYGICDNSHGLAVCSALRNGHIGVVDSLLRERPINDDYRGLAVKYAAEKGHMDIIERLLEGGARIPQHYRDEAVHALGQIGIIFPALNNLVYENFHLDLEAAEEGIDVHNGQRDDKTRSALELLWRHNSSLSGEQIEKSYQDFLKYFDTLPESEEKSKAHRALMVEKKANEGAFGPLVGGEDFSVNGFCLTGKELVGRLWNFVSQCEEKEQLQAKTGMINALAKSFEEAFRVCNQGKTQRLLVAVLQGRLQGVNIDDVAPVLSPDQVLDLFFKSDGRRGLIKKKEELLVEAENFLQLNPNVERASFMAKLEDYWMLRGDDEEEAVQGGAAQGGAAQEE